MSKIIDLLHEFQDLFPTKLFEIKGISGELGEVKVPLNPYAWPMKQRLYTLNLRYKEHLKVELEKMLDTSIIKTFEESKWISLMVVQDKKTSEIRVYFDLRKLNDASIHDLFPTSFIDEALERVGGQKIYSFIDGFSGYHQISVAKEDRKETTFVTEWGCF